MLIGILADSHDNVPMLKKAVTYLNEQGVGFVIHAGDFVAPFALKPLLDLRCHWIGVFGNNDGETRGLTTESKGRIQPGPYELALDGKKILVVHDLKGIDRQQLDSKKVQIVVSGHMHEPQIRTGAGEVLFVNPGELGGWLNGKSTLAIVDTTKMEARIETLPADP